jgi:hypothetical protein
MAADDVRNVLRRALFEPDFYNELIANPTRALHGYALANEESEALARPGPMLYRFLAPSSEPRGDTTIRTAQPPSASTTVVAVIVVVAITTFVTAVAPRAETPRGTDLAKFQTLVDAIRDASGVARFDLVKTLVNELTQEQ